MKIKNILFSQQKPAEMEKSPYFYLIKKHNIACDFEQFIDIEGIPSREFRLAKIYLQEFNAVILTSRNAVDHLFRLAEDVRHKFPDDMRYFCNSESTAFYLQRYIQYRKRKVFHGKQSMNKLMDQILKFREGNFLVPCSDASNNELYDKLEQNDINYKKAIVYKTVSKNVSQIDLTKYDMLVLFTPAGVKSLLENFPNFNKQELLLGAFGESTILALEEAGYFVDVKAPTAKNPSMIMAIEDFIVNNKL